MHLADFERLVRRLVRDIPEEYLDGVAAIDVSRKALPHPVRADVYTLGECIPMHGDLDEVVSRVVLYHGSFRALAHLRDDFSWRDEAWETLTHELRHHLEWRANSDALEEYDWAADQNFARLDGGPFDPAFYLAAEEIADDIYRVDDDVFLDRVVRRMPERIEVPWHGTRYTVAVPAGTLPVFLTLEQVADPPPGDLIVVLRRRAGLRDLVGRRAPVTQARAVAEPLGA